MVIGAWFGRWRDANVEVTIKERTYEVRTREAIVARVPGRSVSVAIYLHDLAGGGAERLQFNLATEFIKSGWHVIFVVNRLVGELVSHIPHGCSLEILDAKQQYIALPRLVGFLRRARPEILIANSEDTNVTAVIARGLARTTTRTIVIQHCTFSEQVKQLGWIYSILVPLYRQVLGFAHAIVAVSGGVADDLACYAGFERDTITVIHNGVVGDDFEQLASIEPAHTQFIEGAPLILAAGRFVRQKDFATLLEAFASIRELCDARLMIFGDGPQRPELESRANSLGIADRVLLPGFVDNLLPYLKRCRIFVLSSRFEGFGNVVAEALACGTPIVSTDCPHGPSEILDAGRFGRLVPVADSNALGKAILSSFNDEVDRERLKARGRTFTVESCAQAYRRLIVRLLAPATSRGPVHQTGLS